MFSDFYSGTTLTWRVYFYFEGYHRKLYSNRHLTLRDLKTLATETDLKHKNYSSLWKVDSHRGEGGKRLFIRDTWNTVIISMYIYSKDSPGEANSLKHFQHKR